MPQVHIWIASQPYPDGRVASALCVLSLPDSLQVHSKALRGQHSHLIPLVANYKEYIIGLANLGSGRGRYCFCDRECRDISNHDCGILFQLSAMLGQTFQPQYFPVMPVN